MTGVRAVVGHVRDIGIIGVLFVAYVVGLAGATAFGNAMRLASGDSTVEVDTADSPRV